MNKIQKLIFIFLVSLLVLVTISFFLDTKKSNKNEEKPPSYPPWGKIGYGLSA